MRPRSSVLQRERLRCLTCYLLLRDSSKVPVAHKQERDFFAFTLNLPALPHPLLLWDSSKVPSKVPCLIDRPSIWQEVGCSASFSFCLSISHGFCTACLPPYTQLMPKLIWLEYTLVSHFPSRAVPSLIHVMIVIDVFGSPMAHVLCVLNLIAAFQVTSMPRQLPSMWRSTWLLS